MNSKKSMSMTLGAMWDNSIKSQLDKQGIKYKAKDINFIAKSAEAITRLNMTKIITDSQATKLRKKVVVKICQHVKKYN